MNIQQMKKAAKALAQELADVPNFAPAYKKLIASAKKKYGADDPDEADHIIDMAEKMADEMRQDAAERGSLARMAPMESMQDRMGRLLEAFSFGEDPLSKDFVLKRLGDRTEALYDARLPLREDADMLNNMLQDPTGQHGFKGMYGDADVREARDLCRQMDQLIGDVTRSYERILRKVKKDS